MQIVTPVRRAVRRYGWIEAVRRAPRAVRRRLRRRPAVIAPVTVAAPVTASTPSALEQVATAGIDPTDVLLITDHRFGEQIIRKGTTDWPTYKQVFLQEDYAFRHSVRPRTIVDLGANVGYASVWYHHRYPDARIVAVEPDADNVALARVNIALGCRPGAIEIIKSAVWHSETSLKITNPTANKWAFRVNEAEPGERGAFDAITMEMVMQQAGMDVVDLVKIDIEAGERFLFLKNTEWLDRVNAMVIELHDRHTPGCREPVIEALDRHFVDYDEVVRGENSLFTRRHRLPTPS